MSVNDVTQLRIRLQELSQKLEKFDRWLDADINTVSGAWARLDAVWGGTAYQEFTGSWDRMQAAIQQYTQLCRVYEQFLQNRIASLEKFERSQGGLG
jgi:uncharacterized protein YukE